MTLTLRKSLVSLAGRPFALQQNVFARGKTTSGRGLGSNLNIQYGSIFQHCGDAKRLFGHSVVCEKAIHFDN